MTRTIRTFAAKAFFYMVTVVIPLYIENQYFNILEAKWHSYNVACILLIPAIVGLAMDIRAEGLRRPDVIELMAVLLIAVTAISCILSEDPLASFTGTGGWHVGGFSIITLALWYLLINRIIEIRPNEWLLVIAVNIIIVAMAVLHSVRIDAFWLHYGIVDNEYHSYLSTIGQINTVSGYCCMLFPLMLGFYLNSTDRTSKRIFEITLFALGYMMVLTQSDGLYLGMGIAALAIIPYSFRNLERLRRTIKVLCMYSVSLMLVGMLPFYADKRIWFSDLSLFFIRPYVSTAIFAVSMTALVILSRIKASEKADLMAVRAGWAAEGALVAVILGFVYVSVRDFNPYWGTGRGAIWSLSFEKYAELEPVHRIFGLGPEMLKETYSSLMSIFSKPVLTSHSEPIQVMMTLGIAGAVLWLVFWVYIIMENIRSRSWQLEEGLYFLPLMGYLGQSLVNSPVVPNMAFFVIMLALYRKNNKRLTGSKHNVTF